MQAEAKEDEGFVNKSGTPIKGDERQNRVMVSLAEAEEYRQMQRWGRKQSATEEVLFVFFLQRKGKIG